MKKVFLGGTCNESTWRDKLIKMLNESYVSSFALIMTFTCSNAK